jgi:hypothetical protein
VSDDLIYRFLKNLFDHRQEYYQIHTAAKDMQPEVVTKGITCLSTLERRNISKRWDGSRNSGGMVCRGSLSASAVCLLRSCPIAFLTETAEGTESAKGTSHIAPVEHKSQI